MASPLFASTIFAKLPLNRIAYIQIWHFKHGDIFYLEIWREFQQTLLPTRFYQSLFHFKLLLIISGYRRLFGDEGKGPIIEDSNQQLGGIF